MAEISALSVEINLDSKPLESGLGQVKGTIQTVFNSLNNAGTGVESTFNKTADSVNNLRQSFQGFSLELTIEIPTELISQAENSVNSLRTSFSNIEDEVGKSGIANIANQIAQSFSNFTEQNPELVQTLSIIGLLSIGFVELVKSLGLLQNGLKLLTVAFGLTGGSIFLIVTVIAALIAAIVLLIQHWDFVVEAVQSAWNDHIVPIISTAAEAIANVLGTIGTFVENLFNSIVNFISERWTSLINFLKENVPFAESIINKLTPDPEAAKNNPTVLAIKEAQKNAQAGGFAGLVDNDKLKEESEIMALWAGRTKEVGEAAEEAAPAVKKVNEAAVETGEKAENASIKLNLTSGSIGNVGDMSTALTDKLDTLNTNFENQLGQLNLNEGALNTNADAYSNLGNEVDKTAQALKKFEDLELDLDEALLPDSEKLQNALQDRLDNIQKVGEEAGVTQERIAAAQEKEILDSADRITEALRKEEIERLKNSGDFIDGLKAGFLEFVDSVENSNELIANFFANTLSQISQNFSDLLFNVIKGNFDDLADLAEQAFDAILRSFLDLVAAIVTREIVIKIGASFTGTNAGGGGGGFSRQRPLQ